MVVVVAVVLVRAKGDPQDQVAPHTHRLVLAGIFSRKALWMNWWQRKTVGIPQPLAVAAQALFWWPNGAPRDLSSWALAWSPVEFGESGQSQAKQWALQCCS